MLAPSNWIRSSLQAGRDLFHFTLAQPSGPEASGPSPVLVPIRSLGPSYRSRIAAHLLALEPQDRYLRFGYAASDEQVQRYVDQLDFERDEIFGIYNRRLELIAMAIDGRMRGKGLIPSTR